MRKTAIIAGALCAAALGCLGAEVPAPIEVEKGVLDPAGGHVQGFCASDGAFYFTQMKTLYKCDWSGRLLKKVPVVCHTGDICFWEGHVYTSVSVYQGPDKGKGIIQVFDADLNFVREAKLDKSTDGITILDGVLTSAWARTTCRRRRPTARTSSAATTPRRFNPSARARSSTSAT